MCGEVTEVAHLAETFLGDKEEENIDIPKVIAMAGSAPIVSTPMLPLAHIHCNQFSNLATKTP